MSSDEFILGRRPDRRYFSKQFSDPNDCDHRPRRYGYMPLDEIDRDQFAIVKDEVLLRRTAAGKQEIKALFYVDNRQLDSLIFERVSTATGKPSRTVQFALHGDEINKLVEFIELIRAVQFEDRNGVRLDESSLKFGLSSDALKTIARRDPNLIADIAEHDVSSRDIVAIAYRKAQLEVFRGMLEDDEFFSAEVQRLGRNGAESTWQAFFEANQWIFGYGLFYVFASALNEAKLEQIVAGSSIGGVGKRSDALLRTRGAISSLCFVEIKTHKTKLLGPEYRPDVWRPSDELTGAIAQVQRTVDSAEINLRRHFHGIDSDGGPTGEVAYMWQPRSVVVAGTLAEFQTQHGANDRKFSSFELFRRQIVAPEVITFDELYERARFITEVIS